MARTRRPRRAMNQINVVPYIDVMLVLLVIFMVTTPMMQSGVVNLPSVGKADKQMDVAPVFVEINADGSIKVNDKGNIQTTPDVKGLADMVKPHLGDNADRPVVIAADKSVRYEAVMNAMDALKQAGIARVGLKVNTR